ncbi:hypothetical protein VW29_12490 [Devosia limi DSM 17137]|uniref:Choice-of-anchor G family protein n=1 Tax=Devosia limi DSM 17137 TaxID=1121477 RepID=A0A0F5LNZ7_9HYPH|nr:hypothetical protein [Devosia limi]KKB84071.1 hypothetical protein VW29_12490 [Devosia limi DSM 17137]SHE63789.1 hypothetical protein SAMN02745223_00751 [Devosia limi DSM 17137]
MTSQMHSRKALSAIAAACLLTVALPAGTAMAQKVKTPRPATEAPAPAEFSIDIPTINAVDANVDEATLRDIFSGNIAGNAAALAGLDATSITIPSITLDYTTAAHGDGEPTTGTVTFSEIVLDNVSDGIAASITLSGIAMETAGDGTADMGTLSASQFNIGGVLGLYGLVDASSQTDLQTIYTDFSFEGGSLTAPDVSCTFGGMSAAEFKARPLRFSFVEIMALADEMEAAGDDISPELTGKALRMYADILTAFESSPVEFGGIDCEGTDDDGRPLTIALAGLSMAGMSPGIYPALSMDGLNISVEGDGEVSIGSFDFKQMDLSGPIAAIEAAPELIDAAWLEANARALIPAMAGFSFDDVVIDVPDPEVTDARIKATIGGFDLSLEEYLNGLPTAISMTGSNIVVDLPTDSEDQQVQQLLALGITSVDAGFGLAAAWDAEANAIDITDFSFSGVDLATVVLTGTIGNVTEALFGLDEDAALMAALGMVVQNLNVDVTDAGLADIVLASVAAEQGADPATLRPIFAGLAEGTVIGMLAGATEAKSVGAAINTFISGNARNLNINLEAKEKPGIGLMDFMAAEEDPSILIGKVKITATAE